jgi:plastocyanin
MKRVVLAIAVVFMLVGCSSNSKVGDDALLNVKDQIPKNRLGAATTTTGGPSTTAASAGLGIRNTTTRPPTTTTIPEVVVTINGDRSGAASQFEPNSVTVYPNFVVRWTNKDAVARSIVFDDGSKRSPSIAPGQSWTTTFPKTGTFTYQDGTRPYAVGAVTVVAR